MDDLLKWRDEFPILKKTVYLINNSLGAMPRAVGKNLKTYTDIWSTRGVRAWHEVWWEFIGDIGNILAEIINAPPDTVSMHQNVTIAEAVVLSCFEFVDYCAWIAGPQETLRPGGGPKVSFNKGSIITEGTQQQWDGKSPIPRGKIVCGWGQPPYDDRGAMQRTRGNYTHVAISLGNGYVISNSLGNDISIQRIEECFPPDEYTEVQFGDYNWKAQQMTEDPNKSKPKIKKEYCLIPTHI
jgi:hypothetical protein